MTVPAASFLDDWAEVLHKNFPEAEDAVIWRTLCMLLLVISHQPSPSGVAAVTSALGHP